MANYDIIGDIHGHSFELMSLLASLGYQRHGKGYRHPDRQVVFVGDFVDRGPEICEVVKTARAMVDAGDALAVMGNHEYNTIAFHSLRHGKQDEWYRPHSDKNLKQHRATLDQLSPSELADAIAWFRTLPVAIEIDGIRVAHASWQTRDIDCINDALAGAGRFTPDFLVMSEDAGSDLNNAIENVLKGPELQMPDGYSIAGVATLVSQTLGRQVALVLFFLFRLALADASVQARAAGIVRRHVRIDRLVA